MIRGVKFVSIPVKDQDRSIAFFTEKLGFRILTDQPFNQQQRWVELGIPGAETRVVLFKMDGGMQPGSMMNMAFWTDDVESTVAELKRAGVQIIKDAQRNDWGSSAIFADPDGNSYVLSSK